MVQIQEGVYAGVGAMPVKKCWRGHNRWDKHGCCLDCRAIRTRMRRHGLPCRYRPKFALDKAEFNKYRGARSVRLIAELSGLSVNTVAEYYWKGRCAPEPKAAVIAKTLGVNLKDVWRKA